MQSPTRGALGVLRSTVLRSCRDLAARLAQAIEGKTA